MGPEKIVLVLLVVLLLFGAKRIPEIAGSLGKGIREFKGSLNEIDRPLRDAVTETMRAQPTESSRSADRRALDEGVSRSVSTQDDTGREPKRLLS